VRISAEELLTAVLDPESFVSWDSPPVDVGPGAKYAEDLAKAREKSGVDESVVTGVGTVRGRRVAVIACEFSFLAGSIGVAAAERIVSVTLMHPAEPGRYGTTAVVEIDADPTMANRMVEQLHGRIVEGRKIRVYAPLHA